MRLDKKKSSNSLKANNIGQFCFSLLKFFQKKNKCKNPYIEQVPD